MVSYVLKKTLITERFQSSKIGSVQVSPIDEDRAALRASRLTLEPLHRYLHNTLLWTTLKAVKGLIIQDKLFATCDGQASPLVS